MTTTRVPRRRPTEAPSRYASATWTAWATQVFLGVADEDLMPPARRLVEQLMGELDLAISRFRPDSDLVRANTAAGRWVSACDWLVTATEVALTAARETDGLVDPTLGRQLEHLGYDADLDVVRSRTASEPARTAPGPTDLPQVPPLSGAWSRVRTAPGRVLVPFGSALDLGATGKAFAADRISTAVAERIGTDCILSLGGDVAVASRPGSGAEHPWQVAVSERPGEPPQQVVALPHGGVATSTTEHRTWRRDGELLHHLLDPATGRPIRRVWRTATVRAGDCVRANVASTAALVLGERAGGWLTARNLDARLVAADGSVSTVGDWPPGQEGPSS